MSHLILTRDVYLRKALTVLLQYVSAHRKICIIDIESFKSLGSIFRLLQRKKLCDRYRLIFIGGKNVSSRVLEPLISIYRTSGLAKFQRQLTYGRGYSPDYALDHIAKCRNLSMLTHREKQTFFALRDTNDATVAASRVFMSTKTVYSYTRRIGHKLNLSSILQLRQFIYSEFVRDPQPDAGYPIHKPYENQQSIVDRL